MNILIANSFWDEEVPGGSHRIASDFARYMARKGHSVHYLCGTQERAPEPDVVRNGVHLWRYPMPSRSGFGGLKLCQHIFASYRLARRISGRTRIDVLNGHSQLQYLGAALALGRGVMRRFSSHSPLPDEMIADGRTGGWKGAVTLAVAVQIERWVLAVSQGVQVESEFTASLLMARYGNLARKRVKVIQGGIDYCRFSASDEDRMKARDRLGGVWQGDIPTFFAVRRLVVRVGLDMLIRASAALKREGLVFRVFIGGDGPERDTIKEEIRRQDVGDCVRLIGRISEEDLPICYRAADCAVLPSRALECFGLTILEAYAADTPVIATSVGAIPEVMGPDFRAWLTDDVSAESLASRMAAFLHGELRATESLLKNHARLFDLETRGAVLRDWLFEGVGGYTCTR